MFRPQVMMALGFYRFSVRNGGFQRTERETTWRWAELEVIGDYPELQYIGPGLDVMSIAGEIYPHYRGGLAQVDAMRGQAGAGVPLLLLDGTGRVYGLWCIERVRESKSAFLGDGAPRKIEFSVELKKY